MPKVHTKHVGLVTLRWIDAQDGAKMYILPYVPFDEGELLTDPPFDQNIFEEKMLTDFLPKNQPKVRQVMDRYKAKKLDVAGVLLYAERQGSFSEYASRLEQKATEFSYISPPLMEARTDVTAWFLRLYADLGIAPREQADAQQKLVDDYGPGVVVVPGGLNQKLHKEACSLGK